MVAIRWLSAVCHRYMSLRVWMGTAVIFGLFLVLVLPAVSEQTRAVTGTSETPDTSLWYSPADLYRLARVYGAEGRAYYVRTRFTFDIVWPLVYAGFLSASLTLVYRHAKAGPLVAANAVPWAAVAFDLLENTAAAWVMFRFPAPAAAAAQMAPVFTLVKWSLIGLCFALLVLGLVINLVRMLSAKQVR